MFLADNIRQVQLGYHVAIHEIAGMKHYPVSAVQVREEVTLCCFLFYIKAHFERKTQEKNKDCADEDRPGEPAACHLALTSRG